MNNYQSFSSVARGGDHIDKGKEYEDYAAHEDYVELVNGEKVSLAIISDGHGGDTYFRSAKGSKLAVEVAKQKIQEFVRKLLDYQAPSMENPQFHLTSEIKSETIQQMMFSLSKGILNTWRDAVSQDIENYPFDIDPEFQKLDEAIKRKFDSPDYQYMAYGATLVFVVKTENFWFGMHIGDGHHLILFEDGVWGQPIPWDSQCVLNETTSICNKNAQNEFRYWMGWKDDVQQVFECTYGPDDKELKPIQTNAKVPLALFVGSDGVDDNYNPTRLTKELSDQCYCRLLMNLGEKENFDTSIAEDFVKTYAENPLYKRDDVSIAGVTVFPIPVEILRKLENQYEGSRIISNENAKFEEIEKLKRSVSAEKMRAEKANKQIEDLDHELYNLKLKYKKVSLQSEEIQKEIDEKQNKFHEITELHKLQPEKINQAENKLKEKEAKLWQNDGIQAKTTILVYLIDTASTMNDGSKMKAVIKGIEDAFTEIVEISVNRESDVIKSNILEVSATPHWQSISPRDIRNLSVQMPICQGETVFEKGFSELSEKLVFIEENPNPLASYKFIFISDGNPKNSSLMELQKLKEFRSFSDSERIGIALGKRVNTLIMGNFVSDLKQVYGEGISKAGELRELVKVRTVKLIFPEYDIDLKANAEESNSSKIYSEANNDLISEEWQIENTETDDEKTSYETTDSEKIEDRESYNEILNTDKESIIDRLTPFKKREVQDFDKVLTDDSRDNTDPYKE